MDKSGQSYQMHYLTLFFHLEVRNISGKNCINIPFFINFIKFSLSAMTVGIYQNSNLMKPNALCKFSALAMSVLWMGQI